MLSIGIVCLPQVFDSALHIMRDVLSAACEIARAEGYEIVCETLSRDGQPVPTASGQVLVPDGKLGRCARTIVVVPGVGISDPAALAGYMDGTPAVSGVAGWLRRQHEKGAEIAAGCTGTWVLAEAGLLDGRLATTTWHLGASFQRRYPRVLLDQRRMVTVDGGVRCAGAAMAHMDLALSLVGSRISGEVARKVGALLLLDNRPSQAQYMVAHHLGDVSEDFRRVGIWISDHLGTSFTIGTLAGEVGLSLRTLARRVKEATGESPLAYVQRLRVERAIYLIETTSDSFDSITRAVGYGEPATLRRLIRKGTGRAPSDFRRR